MDLSSRRFPNFRAEPKARSVCDLRAVDARDPGRSTEFAPCAVIYFQIVSALALAKGERTALALITRIRMIHTGTNQIRQCSGECVDSRCSACGVGGSG
jgi:hypothetical protein